MAEFEKLYQKLGLDVELSKELLASINRTFQNTVGVQKDRPKAMAYFDKVLHESHIGRIEELVEARENGKKIIGYFCIYVPDEIAIALDVVPIPLCGGSNFPIPYSEKMLPRDICPLVKSTMGLALSRTCPYAPIKDMAVGETTCDAKKKTWDAIGIYVMEVPQKKENIDFKLWHDEVVAFKEKLEEISQQKLEGSKLAHAVKMMNDKRRALQRLNELRKENPPPISGLDALVVMQAALNDEPLRFTAKLNLLNAELEDRITKGISPFSKGTKRIMVSGCPAVMGNWKVHSLFEKSGAAIVVDETCTGTRYFSNLVDENSTGIDGQLSAIADRYMKIDCACFSPNNERIDEAVEIAKDYNVGGVVHYVLQYCHGYNIEAIRLNGALKEENIPDLKIETDYSEEDIGQLRTRIEAFLERLGE